MNTTSDQSFAKLFSFNEFLVDRIVAMNASTSLSLAAGGIYTGAGKSGTAIVAAAQAYAGLTVAAKSLILTLANSDKRADAALYLSLLTGQGAASTCDICVFGTALS